MLDDAKTREKINYIKLKFGGVTCPGCIKAIEDQVNNIQDTAISKISGNSGDTIISTALPINQIVKGINQFQGCCKNCDIRLVSAKPLEKENIDYYTDIDNEYELMQKQYKVALQRAIDGIEVACSEHCVCKNTDIDRFKEASEAPSFASVYNLSDYILDFLDDGVAIIDFGSGTGHDVFKVAKLVPNSTIIGIDVTSEMVHFANLRAKELNFKNVFFIEGYDLRELEDESQDLVYLNNVFNLLPSKIDFLKDASRVLRSGGQLLIADEFTKTILPSELRNDSAFRCGGISGAELIEYIVSICEEKGFRINKFIAINEYNIEYCSIVYPLETGILMLKK